MDEFTKYKFPQKVKKYNIGKPSLMVFISKYENNIPWENGINCESSLENYISNVLLPELEKACSLPIILPIKKTYFVDVNHINMDVFTSNYSIFETNEIQKGREILAQQGEIAVKVYLADIINKRKSITFKLWINRLKKDYKHDPAFVYMLLRSIFQTTSYGSRRELDVPDKDVIQWLNLRINRKLINPQESLSKNYFLKKSFGAGNFFQSGWQFVPSGTGNSAKLSAASRGSGWCIADKKWAAIYLNEFSFFILRNSGKSVVALRVYSHQIVECVGINNSIPIEFLHDIKIFTNYMNLKDDELLYTTYFSDLSFNDYPVEWWQKRIEFWPGAYFLMDEKWRNKIDPPTYADFIHYIKYIPIEQIQKDFKLCINFGELIKLVTINPFLYEDFMVLHHIEPYKDEIKSNCILGWLEKIERGELTFSEMESIPPFVKELESYQQLISNQISTKLYKALYKAPKTFLARKNRINLSNYLVYSKHENYDITLKRTTSIILNVESSDFSDNIFPDYLRQRFDFNKLVVDAWKETINERPSFRLALPSDLSTLPGFGFDTSKVDSGLLQKAIDEIIKKPWYLDSNSKFPQNIRHKEEALKAYIKGWQALVLKKPYRLWVTSSKGFGNREYLSYAALRNKQIVDTFVMGFKTELNKNIDIWLKLSDRTQKIPVLKMAFLIALHCSKNERLKKKYFGQGSPLKESNPTDSVNVLNEKIIKLRASFCFQNFKNNCLGNGIEFSDFPDDNEKSRYQI
jgi:hypothetical protein